jgi:hypothetical protein
MVAVVIVAAIIPIRHNDPKRPLHKVITIERLNDAPCVFAVICDVRSVIDTAVQQLIQHLSLQCANTDRVAVQTVLYYAVYIE